MRTVLPSVLQEEPVYSANELKQQQIKKMAEERQKKEQAKIAKQKQQQQARAAAKAAATGRCTMHGCYHLS